MKKQKISMFFTLTFSDGEEIINEKKFKAQFHLVLNPAFENKRKNAVISTIEGTFNDVPEVSEIFDDVEKTIDNVNLSSSNKVSFEYLSKKKIAEIKDKCSEYISMEICAEEKESFLFDCVLGQINMLADRQYRKGLSNYFNQKKCLIDGMEIAEFFYKKENQIWE